jgi:hypothetical protein
MSYNSKLIAASILSLGAMVTLSAADEQYAPKAIVQLPDGQSLKSFDISTLDPRIHTYALADRTNKSIDIIDTQFNVVVKQLHSDFVGRVADPGKASGPNGVIIVEHKDVWVADGPVLKGCPVAPATTPPCTVVTHSTVKVIDLETQKTKKVVDTGGQRRSDELCYNPRSDWVLVANDAPEDNYLTFIKEDTYETKKLRLDGKPGGATDPNTIDPKTHKPKPITANGIEQCVFNPRDGKFYLSLPDIGGGAGGHDGAVVRISEHPPFHVEKVFPIAAATGCQGPQGTVIGPAHQIGLGCGGTNSLIIDDRDGSTIKIVTGQGGTDEAWYDPGNNHYFFGQSAGVMGVEDAGPPPKADPPATTAVGSKNPAVDPHRNQVYVPVLAGAGTICSSNTDVFGHKGDDTKGCIAIYTAPSDKDDCLAEGEAVIAVNEEGDPEHRKVRCDRD